MNDEQKEEFIESLEVAARLSYVSYIKFMEQLDSAAEKADKKEALNFNNEAVLGVSSIEAKQFIGEELAEHPMGSELFYHKLATRMAMSATPPVVSMALHTMVLEFIQMVDQYRGRKRSAEEIKEWMDSLKESVIQVVSS